MQEGVPLPAPSPLLVVISGPSGVGKDAVLTRMRAREAPRHYVVTATTRPPRSGEVNGVDYVFLATERFRELLAAGELLEWAEVYGNYYGVPKSAVAEGLARGLDVVVKTDVQGAASIRRLVPEAVGIFLAPASLQELETRLRGRGTEAPPDLARRLATARQELAQLPQFDYVVVNRDGGLDDAVDTIEAILRAERCRTHPRQARLP
ncbi:MAG: guanylate kinase [Chloroflexi bacterium]|nr:guanylate kinase [Chloroflexota bacterium]